jgi:hypothetical protein
LPIAAMLRVVFRSTLSFEMSLSLEFDRTLELIVPLEDNLLAMPPIAGQLIAHA